MSTPATLPANFFDKQPAPATLPADFFLKQQKAASNYTPPAPISADTSSAPENAPPAPTPVKLSDFVPTWRTPINLAEGLGTGTVNLVSGAAHAILHPGDVVAGIGQSYDTVKKDLEDRQYFAGLIDTLQGLGFDERKAEQEWSAGQGAKAVGEMAPTAALTAEGAAKLPGDIAALPETLSKLKNTVLDAPRVIRTITTPAGRESLTAAASALRDSVHAKTLQAINVAADTLDSHISRLVRGIDESDLADLKTHPGAGIDTKPLTKGIEEAQNVMRQVGQKMPSADAVANRLNQFMGMKLSFEEAKQLRTDIGSALDKSYGAQRAIISRVYGDLTDALRNRADQLGMSKEFAAYNKLYAANKDYFENGIIRDLEASKNSGQFFRTLDNKGARAAIINVEKDLGQYGLAKDFLQNSLKSVRTLHDYLEDPTQQNLFGIIRKAMRHPVATVPAFILGKNFGGFYGGAIGALITYNLAERLAVMRAIERLGGAPEIGGKFGEAANVVPRGASIGEQMAAKGQEPLTPQSFGGSNGTGGQPGPSPHSTDAGLPELHPEEQATLESQAGRPLTTEEAQRLRVQNAKSSAVQDMLAGNRHTVEEVESMRREPVKTNGSGESSASLEAQIREKSMTGKGEHYISVDTRTGQETPLNGVDAHDLAHKPKPYDITYKVDKDGRREKVMEGSKASIPAKARATVARAEKIKPIKQALSSVEKAKDVLSPEEYKIAVEYLKERLMEGHLE